MNNLFRTLKKTLLYFLALSPIIISSFVVPFSILSQYINTLLFAGVIFVLISVLMLIRYRKETKNNIAEIVLIVGGFVYVLYEVFTSDSNAVFTVFGKSIEDGRAISVFFLVVSFAYFLFVKGTERKIALFSSVLSVLFTVLSYFLIKNGMPVSRYAEYLNAPMFSSGELFNLAFIYSVVVLVSTTIGVVLGKHLDKAIVKKSFLYFVLITLVVIIALFTLSRDIFRYIGEVYFVKAQNSYALNDLGGAEKKIKQATRIAPFDNYYIAYTELINTRINNYINTTATTTEGYVNTINQMSEKLILNAEEAVSYDASRARNHMVLGSVYERVMFLTGNNEYLGKALGAYEKARKLASDKDSVDLTRAKLHYSLGNKNETLKYIENALSYNPSSPTAYYYKYQFYLSGGDKENAMKSLLKAVELTPNDPSLRLDLGQMYFDNKDYKNSVIELERAFQLTNGNNMPIIYFLGIAYASMGDYTSLRDVVNDLSNRVGADKDEIKYLKSLDIESAMSSSSSNGASDDILNQENQSTSTSN